MNSRFLLVFSLLVTYCSGYKVFIASVRIGKSHFLFTSTIVQALLDRGHEVTFMTVHSLSHLKLANYTEIRVDVLANMASKDSVFPQDELLERMKKSTFSSIYIMNTGLSDFNKLALSNENVQKFINSSGLHYDVVILEECKFIDSFLMFGHKFKAPVITISLNQADFIERRQGLILLPSHAPHYMTPYSDEMSLTERWYNTVIILYDWFVHNFIYLPSEEANAKKYFAQLAPLLPLNDLINNISMTFVYSHRATSPPRPVMPNVIPIGGAHIQAPKPLPDDMQNFLDDADNGVIYFSLGSILQSSKLPNHIVQSFIESFRNLKQRVLWKYENETDADMPSNVMVRKWIPQNDVLAHPNVVLFISHGGLFGTTESSYHGVPMVLIPFYLDQFRNAYRIQNAGYGKLLDFSEISTESFSKAINDIIFDKSFMEKAKQTSALFKDNVVKPMDEVIFWIEHIAKFKGAKYLKSHAVNMSWFSYFCYCIS